MWGGVAHSSFCTQLSYFRGENEIFSRSLCLLASAMNRFSPPSVSWGEGEKHFLFLYNFLFSDLPIWFYNYLYVTEYLLALLKLTFLILCPEVFVIVFPAFLLFVWEWRSGFVSFLFWVFFFFFFFDRFSDTMASSRGRTKKKASFDHSPDSLPLRSSGRQVSLICSFIDPVLSQQTYCDWFWRIRDERVEFQPSRNLQSSGKIHLGTSSVIKW